MGSDVGLGVLGWGLLALMAVAFGFVGLWVDAARQRAIREQQRRSMAGGRRRDEQGVED
jgi:hypothetical protein